MLRADSKLQDPLMHRSLVYASRPFVVPRLLAPAALALALGLSGCASQPVATFAGNGTVRSIREFQEPNRWASLLGGLAGAAVGGVVGANVSTNPTTQAAAASVLSVATGTAGAATARLFGTQTHYEVLVRFEDGIDRSFRVDAMPAYKPDAKVRAEAGVLKLAEVAAR
jgi:outer membrane lipoprotein SlyB